MLHTHICGAHQKLLLFRFPLYIGMGKINLKQSIVGAFKFPILFIVLGLLQSYEIKIAYISMISPGHQREL